MISGKSQKPVKLIIQIPCLNEAEVLPDALRDLPRQLPGVSTIEWLVIDDGSTDETVSIAKSGGVDHVVRHPRNLGLARAFTSGLEACIQLGADIIVNTDADNQYNAADLPALIAPILEGRADVVIGARSIGSVAHFSATKKILQWVGSFVVRIASGAAVPDAPSGFRAMSRRAAMQVHVFNAHTYTLETIIQAGRQGLRVVSVPVRTNAYARPSRLISSIPGYVARSALTIVRIFATYRPFAFFAWPAVVFLVAGAALGGRFVYYYALGEGQGHIQSLILTTILLGASGVLLVLAFLADLISVNRRLLERLELKMYESSWNRRDDA